jgi:hypothetical protein
MPDKLLVKNESGVSEVVGFILIIGIMMAGIAIVTLYGYPALLKEQTNANLRNMERNMIVLQNDLKSLTYKSVPYKETAIQVSGGTLSLKNPGMSPSFNIEIGGVPISDMPFKPGELHYYSMDDQSVISLENGGVHKNYWGDPQRGSVMLAEPRWFYDVDPITGDATFVIYLIKIHGNPGMATTGTANVQMKVISATQETLPTNGNTVLIDYNPDNENNYYRAWDLYFDDPSLKMNKQTSGPAGVEYSLDSSVKQLIVKRYDIELIGL